LELLPSSFFINEEVSITLKIKISFISLLEKIEKVLAYIAGAFIIAMMLLVTLDVVLRNFFHSPIPGVYEIVGFLFVSAVGLGLPYVQAQRGNISINIASRLLPMKVQKLLVIIAYVLALFTVSILAWQNGKNALYSLSINEYTMGIVHFSFWPSKMILTLGLGLLAIRLLYDLISLFKSSEFIEEEY
jgi:TRAP-type C4-dicarboxylate transport system permease small subunit